MRQNQKLELEARAAFPGRPRAHGFFNDECASFLEIYQGLQRETGRIVPPRSALTPRVAPRLMPLLSILAVESADVLRLRLIGTGVAERSKMDATGANYLDLVPPRGSGQYEAWR